MLVRSFLSGVGSRFRLHGSLDERLTRFDHRSEWFLGTPRNIGEDINDPFPEVRAYR